MPPKNQKMTMTQRQFIARTVEELRREKVSCVESRLKAIKAKGITQKKLFTEIRAGRIKPKNPDHLIIQSNYYLRELIDVSDITFRQAETYSRPEKATAIAQIAAEAHRVRAAAMLGEPKNAEQLVLAFIDYWPEGAKY